MVSFVQANLLPFIRWYWVEANKISSSRTNKTTAVITALQDLLYKDLIYQKGKEAAKLYLEANLECIRKYEKLSKNTPLILKGRFL